MATIVTRAGKGSALTNNEIDANFNNLNTDKYEASTILGTVSESAGVPTGAVIERGSNANGEYVKFADGTMICTISNSVTDQAIDGVYGSIYQASRSWTYPAAFAAAPTVHCGLAKWGSGAGWGGVASAPTTTSVVLRVFDAVTRATGTTFIYSATAIGRWF